MNRFLAALALTLVASTAAAQSPRDPAPHDPARLFPHEAPITIEGRAGELHRLPLTAEVLERTRPDLSDLRIHDERGQDVPYLVDSGARSWPRDATLPLYEVMPVGVDRRIEEGESLVPIWREILRVAPPTYAPEGTRWSLRVGSSRSSFVRTVVVRHVEGDVKTELARGSIYRFDDPVRERLGIALPELPPAARGALLEIEVFGEGGYIEPELRFGATRAPVDAPTLTLPLAELAREQRDGITRIELARPVGVAPDRIRFITSTGHFHRAVRVVDVAQGEAPRELGHGTVFRVQELEGAELVEIDVRAARGESLRIEIEGGDSPPLARLRLEAVVRQPVLVFAPPHGAATLRFGGGRAHAPRYDLRAFTGTMIGETLASSRPLASLGPVRDNPRFDAEPALRFAMRAGRPAEVARFTHVAPVTVSEAAEGLTELRLSPAALAFARFDLADVRVVDAEGRQWPYLVAQNDEPERVTARAAAPEIEDRRSTYVITPPVSRARLDRVLLHTGAAYLARTYVLRGIDDDGRRVELTRGMLSRQPEDEIRPIEIVFPTTRVSRLELEVEDGSDAPLAFERVELGITSPSVYLAAPAGEYRLLVGDAEASAPAYEIERARALVLAVRAGRAELGELAANPAHVAPPWYEAAELSTWIVWALLLVAVLVLGFVTLRLARAEPGPGGPPPDGPPPGDEGGGSKDGDEPPASGGEPPKPFAF